MAWRMHARDSTHSATGRRERRRVATPEYGLMLFVDGPSARYNPLSTGGATARKDDGSFDRRDQVASGVCLRIIPRSR